MNSHGICGSNLTTDSFLCLCGDQPYNFTCPGLRSGTKLIIHIGVFCAGTTMMYYVLFLCVCGKQSILTGNEETNINEDVEAFIQNIGPLAVKRYKFSDVLKESKGNGEDFVNEVASISRTSHVNVVTLFGYCFDGQKKALIYEFMHNGSLEKFIYKDTNPLETIPHLDFERLFQIATGIARGVEYLHRGCNTRILHFDIKPHNILLDENFFPKISDFGLSKLCTMKESIISTLDARGTIGYVAPEVFCRNFGRVSAKSDVYSYGMMILEMVGGRKNVDTQVSHTSEIYFPDWVYENLEQDSNFGLLNAVTEEEKEIARKMILVGLWCIQTRPSDRPSMNKVIEMLEGSVEALQIPPKHVISSPARTSPESSTLSVVSVLD
ncbi:LEAF RUST 10 DISEASE-RESISTANCE LOCUS RECEPTOR-LIKE PROTEIN KINASE-like 2.5 isoform X3 [Rosa chinensis]|uniref:LEAF RUST 10 DISEASE-RESISTANCE LOCUS RECEPTOR-LIKE PROTEIN KINASE-like 2.5 isoform X3 n=1 Tax=Rosa chinensis TaxID=74649 RepID=UPI001AD90535|nr:LEAF RUST 10 DISEASE-RESISTANCE LOCUS RECEPTOR-LIKE PROTEIN KINASE-like 2.5 isoform X3 [Rosa chinensis]